MTVHVHLDKVVVDGPLPGGRRAWRAALERELGVALAGTSAGLASGWPAAGADLADLPPAHLPVSSGQATRPAATDVAAAVGSALSSGGRR